MPELPEVQTILTDLRQAGLIGRHIQRAQVNWSKTVATPDISTFLTLLPNKTIQGLSRRGKFLILHLSNHYDLLIHLRMTGRLSLVPDDEELSPHIRLILYLDNHQQLRYHDARKFGRWHLVRDQQDVLRKIGPEPLDKNFSAALFKRMMSAKRRALKALLLDQTFIAGLGNIYVDEALWEACLHPLVIANSLTEQECFRLHAAIQHVLKRGIESQGTTLGTGQSNFYRLDGKRGAHQTLLKVFRRAGQRCERCSTLIERLVVAQRGTHICPRCQQLKNNP